MKGLMETQLADQYMRTYRSQHGIYLLVNLEVNRTWHLSDRTIVNFAGLCTQLQEDAYELIARRRQNEKITIVAIDLSPGN